MKTTTVIFDESLHHICLMYGLKQTFARMPFLNKKVLEIRGRVHFRHPFMKAEIRDGRCKETSSGHLIAEIQ